MRDETTNGDEQAGGDELAKKRRGRKANPPAPALDDIPEALRVPPGKGPRKRKAKQTTIPGTERHERHPDIETAAEAYAEVRDERMALTKKEVAAREVLRAKMKEHGLTLYECDAEDLTVELIPSEGEKVKVKRREAEEDDDDLEAG